MVLVLLLGMGGLAAGARQVRLQDAVADAARLAARGESDARVLSVVTGSVPGADGRIENEGDLVCVTASVPAAGLPLLMDASSCALAGGL